MSAICIRMIEDEERVLKKVHTEQLVWYNLFQLGQLFRASPHCCCSEFERSKTQIQGNTVR